MHTQNMHSIAAVIQRMEESIELYKKEPQQASLVVFLYTYYLVTRNVARAYTEDPQTFQHFSKVEQLDIHFAQLYFSPAEAYIQNGQLLTPWRTYFEYCSQKYTIPFVRLLLGINAHINADLAMSVAACGYTERNDYLTVNSILHSTIPDVMTFLVHEERDIVGAYGLFFRRFIQNGFERVIVQWREDAWKNGHLYREATPDKQPLLQKELYRQTEQVAQEIIRTFYSPKHLSLPWKMRKRLELLRVSLSESPTQDTLSQSA
jgi:hypothetical protein